ncbi:MAG: hypothetical protein OEZ21_05110 [Candidatus Bathyarchaeota archaeon]|nr:hypothetical protein [Candidatus Bathyarchaeota archaeon]
MTVKLKVILLIVVITATGICAAVLYSALQPQIPTVETPPELLSSNHFWTNVSENIKFYTIVGEIVHHLRDNIGSINVTATFYDVNSNTIGETTGHPVMEIMKPGVTSPFFIYWQPHEEPPTDYTLTFTYKNTTADPINELRIVDDSNETDDRGYYIVEGEVLNIEWGKAIGPRVYCSYYDSEGRVIVISSVIIASTMEWQEKSHFSVTSEPHKIHPAAYSLLAVPHHYEGLPIARYDLVLILVVAFVIFVLYMKRRGW